MESGQPIELSYEQEFHLKSFEYQIQPIDLDQSRELLVELYRQLLLRESYCKEILKQNLLGENSPFLFE